MFNKFLFRLSILALVAKIWPNKLCDGDFLAIFLRPAFPASLCTTFRPSKFENRATTCVGPRSMVDIQSATAEIRRGKKKKKEETGQKYNVRICYAGRP